MVQLGQVDVPDDIACVVKTKVDEIGGFAWISMGIVMAESGFDPNTVGDAGCSIGLLQLNTCGGQGSDYAANKDALKDPKLNLDVGQPPIARAVLYCTQQGFQGEQFIREVARRSGHPGFIDLADYRLTNIYNDTIRLITFAGGALAPWPYINPVWCNSVLQAPDPLGSWSEGPQPTDKAQAETAMQRHFDRVDALFKAF